MDIELAALPDDVETRRNLVRSLAVGRTSLSEAKAEIERLNFIMRKLQRTQFGRRSEQLDDHLRQLGFEDLNTDLARVEASLPPASVGTKTPNVKCERTRLPEHPPRRRPALYRAMRPGSAAAVCFTRSARRSARCSIMCRRGGG
jgi:transposase